MMTENIDIDVLVSQFGPGNPNRSSVRLSSPAVSFRMYHQI